MLTLKLFLLINLVGYFLWYTPFHSNSYHLNILNLSFNTSVKGAYSGSNYRVDRLMVKPEKVDLESLLMIRFPGVYCFQLKFIYVT